MSFASKWFHLNRFGRWCLSKTIGMNYYQGGRRRTCAKIGLRMKLALAAHPPALLPHQIKSQILHCNVSQLFCSSLPLHIKELPHLRPHVLPQAGLRL